MGVVLQWPKKNNFVVIYVIAKIMYDVKIVAFFNNIVKQLSRACL